MQEDGNIMDFYVNGDVAPSGRFNFHYYTDVTSEVPNINLPSFLIFPNPANNYLDITFPLATTINSQLTIYTITGQPLWQKKYGNSIWSDWINIDFIKNNGIYVIELYSRGKRETKKLIVNK